MFSEKENDSIKNYSFYQIQIANLNFCKNCILNFQPKENLKTLKTSQIYLCFLREKMKALKKQVILKIKVYLETQN